MQNEVCHGECLFGKCPNKTCVKYAAGSGGVAAHNENMRILTAAGLPAHTPDKAGYGFVADIGTTTVVVYLYSLGDSKLLGVKSALNAQTQFGLDVISRIKYCGDREDGLSSLRQAITTQLNGMLADVLQEAGISVGEATYGVITGNTTMLHLLRGLSPVSMGVLPFEPLSRFGETVDAKALSLEIPAQVYLPPCPSSFVGGDVVTGMLACGFAESGKNALLMDIGTNGEVALGGKNRILCSSTAAGPAFEGAHISCGMAGVTGAINKVGVVRGKLIIETIGGGPARGLCGSGLLSAIALFVRAGVIDETGRIADGAGRYFTEVDGQPALKIADGITLTQKDIREVQTAKAAVSAGVKTLIHEMGIDNAQVGTLYIAGGFGNYMDADDARQIGLVPDGIALESVGNAAAAGAALILLDSSFMEKAGALQRACTHTELGNNPYFMDQYVDSMYF